MKLKTKGKKASDEENLENMDEYGLIDTERPVVFCQDPKSFIYNIMMERNMDIDNTLIKIGIDDGQGILKINVQITEHGSSGDCSKSRSKYSDGIAPKMQKLGSVKKLFILLAVPNIPELHENLACLLSEIDISSIDFSLSSDLKIVLMLLGKDSGACRHACPYCESCSPWDTVQVPNSLISLKNWHKKLG